MFRLQGKPVVEEFTPRDTGTSARPPESGMFVMVPIVDNQAPVCKRQATERLDGAREASIE